MSSVQIHLANGGHYNSKCDSSDCPCNRYVCIVTNCGRLVEEGWCICEAHRKVIELKAKQMGVPLDRKIVGL